MYVYFYLFLLTWPPCNAIMLNIGGCSSLTKSEASGALGNVPIGLRAVIYPICQIYIWLSLVLLVISVSIHI